MSSAGAKIAARLPTLLRTARVGLAKIGAGIRSAAPRVAGVVKRAVTSPVGKVAIGAVGVGAGLGLGSYLALSGFGAGQSYAQYATDQALMGQPPPGAPPLPWGQDFLAQPFDQGIAPGYGYDYGGGYGYGYGYGNRLAAFFTSPLVLFILLLFILAIIGIYVWRKTGK